MELNHSRILKDSWPFFLVMGVFWLLSCLALLQWGYEGSFVRANSYHWAWLDEASYYFLTHLGDGLILPCLLLLFMWKKRPELAMSGVVAVLAAGFFTQILKRMIFDDWGRPPLVFAGNPEVNIFHPHPPMNHSFPRGHATTMAAGGLIFAWFSSRWGRILPILVGLFTVLLCFTRVILGVHFWGDIALGSFIGCALALGLLPFLIKASEKLLSKRGPQWEGRLLWIVYAVAVIGIVGQFIHLISKQG